MCSCVFVCVCVYVCLGACVRDRDRETERGKWIKKENMQRTEKGKKGDKVSEERANNERERESKTKRDRERREREKRKRKSQRERERRRRTHIEP